MKNKIKKKYIFLFIIFFILDRLFKRLVILKENFLFLKLFPNPYFLYFFKSNYFNFLVGIILFFIIFLIVESYQKEKALNFYSLLLIFIGGFSNFLDRIYYGFVIDYLIFFNLFTFNISDILIFSGILFLTVKLFKRW